MQGFSLAQEREVSGSVKDASGEPLFGAAVVVEGESKGTGTDMDGKFTIKVAPGKNLEISFLGMKTKVVKVGSFKRIDVVLEVESQDLDRRKSAEVQSSDWLAPAKPSNSAIGVW